MAYGDVLRHRGVKVETTEGANWVGGEPDTNDDAPSSVSFGCHVFLPLTADQPVPRGTRRVTEPTLLLPTLDDSGQPLVLKPESKVNVTCPSEPEHVRVLIEGSWQIQSGPQPFGPPGNQAVGQQAIVKRVTD